MAKKIFKVETRRFCLKVKGLNYNELFHNRVSRLSTALKTTLCARRIVRGTGSPCLFFSFNSLLRNEKVHIQYFFDIRIWPMGKISFFTKVTNPGCNQLTESLIEFIQFQIVASLDKILLVDLLQQFIINYPMWRV